MTEINDLDKRRIKMKIKVLEIKELIPEAFVYFMESITDSENKKNIKVKAELTHDDNINLHLIMNELFCSVIIEDDTSIVLGDIGNNPLVIRIGNDDYFQITLT